MAEQQRLVYPDACKFVAIFIVTCSHCAQCISGEIWTNFLGGTVIDIAFTMPLFMLLSGWFLNLEKLRSSTIIHCIVAKFKRLILPAISWFIIYCILTVHIPDFSEVMPFYWYLSALFICLCIIIIASKIFKSDIICALLSTIVVLLCPYSDYVNVNFMFPYLWSGYYLRKVFDGDMPRVINLMAICSLIIGILLSIYWTPNQSVYNCPLTILEINRTMIYTYIYRFTLGLSLSIFIIYVIKKCERVKKANIIADYGRCSLVIYTLSFVINGILSIMLYHFNIHTNKYFVIDLLSILTCICIVAVTILLCKKIKIIRMVRLLLMGE